MTRPDDPSRANDPDNWALAADEARREELARAYTVGKLMADGGGDWLRAQWRADIEAGGHGDYGWTFGRDLPGGSK